VGVLSPFLSVAGLFRRLYHLLFALLFLSTSSESLFMLLGCLPCSSLRSGSIHSQLFCVLLPHLLILFPCARCFPGFFITPFDSFFPITGFLFPPKLGFSFFRVGPSLQTLRVNLPHTSLRDMKQISFLPLFLFLFLRVDRRQLVGIWLLFLMKVVLPGSP